MAPVDVSHMTATGSVIAAIINHLLLRSIG